ncbi:MAG TPA: hypothetical protein VHL34_04555 [Rhizomicrobium sp.]|jgi:hypothetical protein|nr:hypothetical protein [Rhizomicrobium sp.]
MNPLETYLARVRFRLPRKGRDDIVQELRVALLERFDRQEAEWGRPLSEAEQTTIIRGFGNPITVAARYWTGQGIVGGPFTLYYRRTLLWALCGVLILHAALALWRWSMGMTVFAALSATRPGMLFALISAFAVITAVFVMLDAVMRSRMKSVY